MSVATAHIDIVAPAVPSARPGTVVGAAEVLDPGNRCLGHVPLRAEMSTLVEIPYEEQCLVYGWSPYLSVQPVVVTGGRTEQAVLSARRVKAKGRATRWLAGPRTAGSGCGGGSRTADGPCGTRRAWRRAVPRR